MIIYISTALDEHHYEVTYLFETKTDRRYKFLTSDECVSICDYDGDME